MPGAGLHPRSPAAAGEEERGGGGAAAAEEGPHPLHAPSADQPGRGAARPPRPALPARRDEGAQRRSGGRPGRPAGGTDGHQGHHQGAVSEAAGRHSAAR